MRVGVRGDWSPRGNAWFRPEPKGPRCERLSFEEAQGAAAGGVAGVDALTTGCGSGPRASQTRRPMSAIVLRTNPPGLEIP